MERVSSVWGDGRRAQRIVGTDDGRGAAMGTGIWFTSGNLVGMKSAGAASAEATQSFYGP
jgi:hypothetical protein